MAPPPATENAKTKNNDARPPSGGPRILGTALPVIAVAAAGAAFYVASSRVPALAAVFAALGDDTRRWVLFYHSRWDTAGDPGLWLRLALGVVVPALFTAFAAARAVPGVATRVAGVLTQRAVVYAVIGLSTVGVIYAALFILGPEPLDFDESTFLFQSKVFARGRLAAPAPDTEGDLDHAFFRAKTEVVRNGRWFALYPPLHPALLTLAAKVGWPKLAPAAAALATLLFVYGIGRRTLGVFGAAVAAALAATSPFFIFVQASYLSEATFVFFLALASWGALVLTQGGGRGAALALGIGAGGAFLARDYGALYLALPVGWYLWRRRGTLRRCWFPRALGAAAPFGAAWVLYNWAQTGNPLLPPRYFSEIVHFGFDTAYTPFTALSSWARNVVVLSSDAFGWPMVCLIPVIIRLFVKPRPDDWEKALYGLIVLTFLAQFPIRNAGISYGARYYYVAWFALVFLTARFFVILASWGQLRFRGAGEGAATFALAALVAVNVAVYLPRAAARYADRPWGNYSLWADRDVKAAFAALAMNDAVVVIKPRDWCLSSVPGSPFLDDDVVYARDAGPRNGELARIFPGRTFYTLDYGRFRGTGEITVWDTSKPPEP